MTPAQHLVALAREELALVGAGRFAELDDVAARREVLVDQLPPVPDESTRAHVREALDLHAAVRDLLGTRMAEVRRELVGLSGGRRGVQAYVDVLGHR